MSIVTICVTQLVHMSLHRHDTAYEYHMSIMWVSYKYGDYVCEFYMSIVTMYVTWLVHMSMTSYE